MRPQTKKEIDGTSSFADGGRIEGSKRRKIRAKAVKILRTFIQILAILPLLGCERAGYMIRPSICDSASTASLALQKPSLTQENMGRSLASSPTKPTSVFRKIPFSQKVYFPDLPEVLRSTERFSVNTFLAKGDEWALVIDKQCLKESGAVSFLAKLAYDSTLGTDFQSVKLKLERDYLKEEFQTLLQNEACLLAAEPNQKIRSFATDPQRALQSHISYLKATEAQSQFYTQTTAIAGDVVMAVIDTGVNYLHQDLENQMWLDPATGHKMGVDLVEPSDPDQALDENGHGTHVAGLAAATAENGLNGLGLGGNHIKIFSIRILDENGEGDIPRAINGINLAISKHVDLINLSLGVPGITSPALRAAIQDAVNAGIVVVAAAGNENKQITSSYPVVPAMYAKDIAGFISVTSLDTSSSKISRFSNYSPSYVEIVAPGAENSGIEMLFGGLLSLSRNSATDTARIFGTSMATPLVSAAAAMSIGLLKSYKTSNSGLVITPAVIESLVIKSAIMRNAYADKVSWGRSLDLMSLAQFTHAYGQGQPLPASNCY